MLTSQKNKARYLSEEKEFLKYSDGFYIEPLNPYQKLQKYIIEHQLVDVKCTQKEIEDHTMLVFEMIQRNQPLREVLNTLTHLNYIFEEDNIKGFID